MGRELDTNEQAQRRSQKEQEGSEIRSVELERLLTEGTTLIERRNAFECMREEAAGLFETTPACVAPTCRRDDQPPHADRGAARQPRLPGREAPAETEMMLPLGPEVAFAGGYECNDHQAIWAALDRVHAKHPEMVLLHGGSPKGAERIACWAASRGTADCVADFRRHKESRPVRGQ